MLRIDESISLLGGLVQDRVLLPLGFVAYGGYQVFQFSPSMDLLQLWLLESGDLQILANRSPDPSAISWVELSNFSSLGVPFPARRRTSVGIRSGPISNGFPGLFG